MSARDGDTGAGLSAQAGHTALTRAQLIPETGLTPAAVLLDEGRALAGDWGSASALSLREYGVASEADYKRARMAEGRLVQHALLGLPVGVSGELRSPGPHVAAGIGGLPDVLLHLDTGGAASA